MERLMSACLILIIVGHCFSQNVSNTECCLTVPKSVDDCFAASMNHPISRKSAKIDCLQRLLWFTKHEQNLSEQDRLYFSLLSKSNLLNNEPQPKTGFRTRKEYRQYTDMERTQLHNAFNNLYKKEILRKYAELHKQALDKVHNSGAFLSWHRVFLAMLEDDLRLEDNTVSLPYWDTRLDHRMDNPANSVIWSSKFLGNANGDVITGPFAKWKSPRGNIWREYGSHPRGKLISDKMIKNILTRCKTDDIVFPAQNTDVEGIYRYILEHHYNGAQNWVGGDMSDKHFAAYDPVFYMLLAFVDLIWEQFRVHQETYCGVNPENDYPKKSVMSGTLQYDYMEGFDGFKYADGLKKYWTEKWYTYDNIPKCPDCGSKYLFCNSSIGLCVSHSRRTDFNAGRFLQSSLYETFVPAAEPFEPKTEIIPKNIFGKFLPAPLRGKRTRESAKLDAKIASEFVPPVEYFHPATEPTPRVFLPAPLKDQSKGIIANRSPITDAFSNQISQAGSNASSLNNRNPSTSKNIEFLLNLYASLLKQNLSATVGQSPVMKTNQASNSKAMPVKMPDTSGTNPDLLTRIQKHNIQSSQNLSTQGPKYTPKYTPEYTPKYTSPSPLISLTNIKSPNISPKSNHLLRKRKYLTFA